MLPPRHGTALAPLVPEAGARAGAAMLLGEVWYHGRPYDAMRSRTHGPARRGAGGMTGCMSRSNSKG